MSKNRREFWGAFTRRPPSPRIAADVDDPALICASAVSLSTSALFSALMLHLEQKGILSAEDHQVIYQFAVSRLDTDPADDGGVTELAREIIEQQLRHN